MIDTALLPIDIYINEFIVVLNWLLLIFYRLIDPKVNVIARLVFELAYFEVAVQHVSNYSTETLHLRSFLINDVVLL